MFPFMLYLRQMRNISISYDCIKFIDSYRFLSSSLNGLVKTVDELTFLKREFPDKWELLNKKLAYSLNILNLLMIMIYQL